MKKAIVISTSPKRFVWLNNLLQTLNNYQDYPILIFANEENYEHGNIKYALDIGLDEFFFLQDSVEIKNTDIFKIAFEDYEGRLVAVDPSFKSYLGKYTRKSLENACIPEKQDKITAVDTEQNLGDFLVRTNIDMVSLTTDFNKSNVFEEKFGRVNMILENEYLKKYKATWSREQIIN